MKTPVTILLAALAMPSAGMAQTRSVRDTATTYGARLTARGQPAALNQNRVNNRIASRLDNRLSLRIERYRPDSTDNPTAAFRDVRDDGSRAAPVQASSLRQQQEQEQQEQDEPSRDTRP